MFCNFCKLCLLIYNCVRPPHLEVSFHAGLEDSIKGTLGVGAVIEGEHLFNNAEALLVISCANYCYRHVGVKLVWSVVLSTWRIKDILPQLDRYVELLWIAGVGHLGLHTLSLKEVKRAMKCFI